MRRVKEVTTAVLHNDDPFAEVYPEGTHSKDPAPPKVKEVMVNGTRYIVCRNERQPRCDAAELSRTCLNFKEQHL